MTMIIKNCNFRKVRNFYKNYFKVHKKKKVYTPHLSNEIRAFPWVQNDLFIFNRKNKQTNKKEKNLVLHFFHYYPR